MFFFSSGVLTICHPFRRRRQETAFLAWFPALSERCWSPTLAGGSRQTWLPTSVNCCCGCPAAGPRARGQQLYICGATFAWSFRPVVPFGNLHFIHAPTNATDENKYFPFLSQILTVPEFEYLFTAFISSKISHITFYKRALMRGRGRPLKAKKAISTLQCLLDTSNSTFCPYSNLSHTS